MKVVYFSKYSELGPSSRYRIYQFLPHLSAAGISCQVRPFWGNGYFWLLGLRPWPLRFVAKVAYTSIRMLQRVVDLFRISRVDLVVIQDQLFPYFPPIIERLLVRLRYRLVLEFDDAIYLTRFHTRKIPRLLQLSTMAILGNSALAQYALSYTPRVRVIPTVVDTSRCGPEAKNELGGTAAVTIGWIGLPYNFAYLELIRGALRELQRSHRVRFRVISSYAPRLMGVEVEFRRWSVDGELADLQGCQIGVMPLPDDEWARGKCGLKLLQYMAVGIPSVASPVGVNREIIRDGENGFLVDSEKEWYDRLARLCENSALRAQVGRAARQTVEERYSLRVWGPRLAALYREVGDGERE